MAFNTLDYLEQGKIDFLDSITLYDKVNLIKWIRQSPKRNKIIEGFLDKAKEINPRFCLDVIYDIEEFKEDTFSLVNELCTEDAIYFSNEKLMNILRRTSWGEEYILNNFDKILKTKSEFLHLFLPYVFGNLKKSQEFKNRLAFHKDLHIRATFMIYLVKHHYEELNYIYDDIMKYLTSYTHQEFEQMTFAKELMRFDDLSLLAVCFLHQNDLNTFTRLKEYILKNYPQNDLAYQLLTEKDKTLEAEFLKDIDRLFTTSYDYQLIIYERFSKKLSQELFLSFKKFLTHFTSYEYYDLLIEHLFYNGLGRELQTYVDKYLSLSKRLDSEYLSSGSTAVCYRIGDFVFKLSRMKWSYEDIICPNLYIIHKNLEEKFVRDKEGHVLAGLEVQKYLTKSIKEYPEDIQRDIQVFLRKELERLGYYNTDTLINGTRGDNCMILDTYKDADTKRLELVPEFFKKYPAVYIDRDRFYKIDNKSPKQIVSHY